MVHLIFATLSFAAERVVPPDAPAAALAPAFVAGDAVTVGTTRLPSVAPGSVPIGSPEEAPELWDVRPLVLWIAPGDWRLGWWPHDDFAVGHDLPLLNRVLSELRRLGPTVRLHVEVDPDTPAEEVAAVLAAVRDRGCPEPLDLVVTSRTWSPTSAARLPPGQDGKPLRSSVARPTGSGAFVFENVRGVGGFHTIEASDVLGFREDCRGGYCVVVLVAPDADYLLHIRAQSDALSHRWIANLPVVPWEGPSLANAVTPRFEGVLQPFLTPARAQRAAETPVGYFHTDARVDRSVLEERGHMLKLRCTRSLDTRAFLRWAVGARGQDSTVVFTFSVAGDGSVLGTEIDHEEIRNLSLERCVPREMRRIGFPKSMDGAPYEVEYGVHFEVD